MYKLLVVSDRPEIVSMVSAFQDWELLGCRRPHFRDTIDGALECLQNHSIKGIGIALSDPAMDDNLMNILDEQRPYLSVFTIGSTQEELSAHLRAFSHLQDLLHADCSNDDFSEEHRLESARHEFIDKLLSNRFHCEEEVEENLRLLRSKTSRVQPCILEDLSMPEEDAALWRYGSSRLSTCIHNFFKQHSENLIIRVCVLSPEKVRVLVCPHRGFEVDGDELAAHVSDFTQEALEDVEQYIGFHLQVDSVRILNNLLSLCKMNDM